MSGQRVKVGAERHLHGLRRNGGGGLVAAVLSQQVYAALQVGLRFVEVKEPEPLGADRHQIEPAIVVLGDLAQRRDAADLIQGGDTVHPPSRGPGG